jgi:hypothetical protein
MLNSETTKEAAHKAMTFTITQISRQIPHSRSEFQDGILQSLP